MSDIRNTIILYLMNDEFLRNFCWYFGMAFQQFSITSDEIEIHFCAKITENFRFKEKYHTTSKKNMIFMENTESLDTS